MPCYEPVGPHSPGDAILCGVFRLLESTGQLEIVLNALPYEQIGLRKSQVEAWWLDHQKLDAKELRKGWR